MTVFLRGESLSGTCIVLYRGGDVFGVNEVRCSGDAGTMRIGEQTVRTPMTVDGRGGKCFGGAISKRSSVALTDRAL